MLGKTVGPLLRCLCRPLLQRKLKQQDENRNKNQSKIFPFFSLKEMTNSGNQMGYRTLKSSGGLFKNRRPIVHF